MTKEKKLRKKRYLIIAALCLYLLFNWACMSMRLSLKDTKTFFNEKNVAYIDSSIVINDTPLHYISTGQKDKQTLVFIHGSPGSWEAFKSYLADSLMTNNYRLIAVDRPGFGYSDYRKAKNLEAQALLINTLLTQLDNNNPYTLIGHSYGGPLITKMAVLDSALYKNLIIVAGALDPLAEKPEKWRKVFKSFPLKYAVPGALKPSNEELWWLKDDLYTLNSFQKSHKMC